MFRVISIISFLSIVVVLVYFSRNLVRESEGPLARALAEIRKIRLRDLPQQPQKLVYVLGIVSFIILALSGFLPILFTGHSVTGVLLLFHVVAAPVFAVCIAIVSILWAHHHRFNENDGQSLLNFIRQKTENKEPIPQLTELWQKITFWLILLLSLPVVGSVILSMYPLFGTHGQEVLLGLHGYSALFLVMAVVMSSYLVGLTQKADSDRDND
ncbi:MAG: hypothetical protein ACE5HO_15775 [bacterium]